MVSGRDGAEKPLPWARAGAMRVVTGLISGHRITPPKPPGTLAEEAGGVSFCFSAEDIECLNAVSPVSESPAPEPNPNPQAPPLPANAKASSTVRQSPKTERGRL